MYVTALYPPGLKSHYAGLLLRKENGKCSTVKKLFEVLDGYIRARLRSFKAKKRTWKTILYTLPQSELKKMGLISLSSLLNESVS